jgi:hypothetical protein
VADTRIAAVESACAGEALLVCAGQRELISPLASDREKELFSTTPAELASRNRRRRPPPDPSPGPAAESPATPAAARLADLFDDVDATSPVPLQAFRRRARP